MTPPLIESFLPEDNPEREFLDFYSQVNMYVIPLAFLVSYRHNKDLKWALIHSLFALPYLTYAIAVQKPTNE